MGSAGLPLMLLLAGTLARIPGSEGGKETPAHFLVLGKAECRFLNGTRRVRFLERYFYDREEILRFDSARGQFEAVTVLGKVDARAWNRNQRLLLDAKASVDYFCRANCEALQGGAVIGRRGNAQPRCRRLGGKCFRKRCPPKHVYLGRQDCWQRRRCCKSEIGK